MFAVIGCVKVAPGVVSQSLLNQCPLSHPQLENSTLSETSFLAVPASATSSPNSLVEVAS